MEDLTRLIMLYDFYGDFLTPKQREIFELYHLNDLSLGEIAEITGVTRQGIHDMIRRSQDALNGFENTLGMVRKSYEMENSVQIIIDCLDELRPFVAGEGIDILNTVYKNLGLLLKEGGE